MNSIFLKLLNMSITASWLILAVILARLLLKKAPKWISCALWGLVAIRLIYPFSFKSIFSLIPSSETIPSNIALQNEPHINSGIRIINDAINPIITGSFAPDPVTSMNPLQAIIPIAAIVWVSGIVFMLAYALVSYLKLKKNVSVCVPIKEGILSCDEVKAPFILGVIRPVIYVPSSMHGEKLDYVLRHETVHLQRYDHWWKPLGFLLLSVYWFNPLCWLAYIMLCRDIEMACDEKVIRDMDKGSIAAYSQALLDCSFPRKRIAACPLAFGETGIKERVKGVLNYRKPTFWIIMISVIACIVLALCLMTDPFSNKNLSEKLGVSMDMAVKEHNRSSHSKGNFITTDYDVLLVSESGNETTVYAWVLYEEYSFDGREPKSESGSHIPVAITFDTSTNDSSTYDVIEYWEPRDGNYYADDIRAKFPWSIRGKALDSTRSRAKSENCLRAAREYYKTLYTEGYSLNDGKYAVFETADKSGVPYLLINEGRFSIIQDIAVSYQPSGKIERNNNTVTMKSDFAGETYIWVFELVNNDQLKLKLDDSKVPANHDKWKEGMVFKRDNTAISTVGGYVDPGSVTQDIRTDVCELYMEVLEDLWNVDSGMNQGISQIGIDLSELSHLTGSEKETVMREFASKHNLPYIAGTWEELCEQGYIDRDNLSWKDGLFFSIKTNEDGDSAPDRTAFDARKWRSGLAAYFFGQCTAQKNADGKWYYTVGQEAIS